MAYTYSCARIQSAVVEQIRYRPTGRPVELAGIPWLAAARSGPVHDATRSGDVQQ
jgi:hypothetical protein